MHNPTIRDVARHAGVGIGTVSRVLNGSPKVREETRQRVQNAIEALGFSPNLAARQLSSGKTWSIGVIAPFFTNPSFVERLNGIQHVLDDSGYDLVLYSIRNREQLKRRLAQIITQNRIDGLIVLALGTIEAELAVHNPALPIIFVVEDHLAHYPHIMIDNCAGGKLATEYLIQHDHTMLGFIGDEQVNDLFLNATRQRYDGFVKALEEAGLPLVDEWCCFGFHSWESAYQLAYDLLGMDDRPTAIFASSDTLASGVIAAIKSQNLRVPQDVAVIGFDDIPHAALLQLTTIRQPLFEGAKLATEYLLERMTVGENPDRAFQTILPLELIQRETV